MKKLLAVLLTSIALLCGFSILVVAKTADTKKQKEVVTYKECQTKQCYEGWMLEDMDVIALNKACDKTGKKERGGICGKETSSDENRRLLKPKELSKNDAPIASQEKSEVPKKFVINGETYR